MRRLLKGAAVSFVSAAAFFVFFTAAAGTRIVPPYLFALAYGFAGRIRAVGAAAGGGGLGYLLPLGGDIPGRRRRRHRRLRLTVLTAGPGRVLRLRGGRAGTGRAGIGSGGRLPGGSSLNL